MATLSIFLKKIYCLDGIETETFSLNSPDNKLNSRTCWNYFTSVVGVGQRYYELSNNLIQQRCVYQNMSLPLHHIPVVLTRKKY